MEGRMAPRRGRSGRERRSVTERADYCAPAEGAAGPVAARADADRRCVDAPPGGTPADDGIDAPGNNGTDRPVDG